MIRFFNNVLTISNNKGCSLETMLSGGKFGLGTFRLNGKAIGGNVSALLFEDNNYTWEPYMGDSYDIIRDDNAASAVRFHGEMGYGTYRAEYTLTVTLPAHTSAFRLDCEINPYPNIAAPVHKLYMKLPFISGRMKYVQYPFETPLTPPYGDRWEILPHLSKVPFMLGCESLEDGDVFIGMGYRLALHKNYTDGEYQYTHGRLVYEPRDAENAFRIYFPYEWLCASLSHEGYLRTNSEFSPLPIAPFRSFFLSAVLSLAENEAECISSYRDMSGFDEEITVRRPCRDTLAALLGSYSLADRGSIYVEGRGYRMRAFSNHEEPKDAYYNDVAVGYNMMLASALYEYWSENREAVWAREKALEMAWFFVKSTDASGRVPDFWRESERRYISINSELTAHGFIYDTASAALGAVKLYSMYEAVKETEGTAYDTWMDAALRIAGRFAGLIEKDGFLGRFYNEQDEFDTICTQSWPLMLLDLFHTVKHCEKFAAARVRLEKYVWKNFVSINSYYSTVLDDTSWRPHGEQLKNNDVLDVANIANYCISRYKRTGECYYFAEAENIVNYLWLNHIPVQLKGYKNITKGLVQEQKIWAIYDAPWLSNTFAFLPYMSAVSGKSFYYAFYRVLIQAMTGCQAYDDTYKFCSIGLEPMAAREGPDDMIAEIGTNGLRGVGVGLYAGFFCSDLLDPDTFRYVGGRDWGMALDCELPYAISEKPVFITASTAFVTAESVKSNEIEFAFEPHGKITVYLGSDDGISIEFFVNGISVMAQAGVNIGGYMLTWDAADAISLLAVKYKQK
jgi:hypothetical protein